MLLFSSCGTMRNGKTWGENVNFLPGWERIQYAAVNAATSAETWVPLGGAFMIQLTNSDARIAGWASQNNPVFGSQKNAERFSDVSLYFARMAYYSSLALTPGGNTPDTWLY